MSGGLLHPRFPLLRIAWAKRDFICVSPGLVHKSGHSAPDYITTTPAIAVDDGLFRNLENTKTFFALNPDGTKKWQFDRANQLPGGFGRIFTFGAVIAHDGTVYFGTSDTMFTNWFYALNPDGIFEAEEILSEWVTTATVIDEDERSTSGLNNATMWF